MKPVVGHPSQLHLSPSAPENPQINPQIEPHSAGDTFFACLALAQIIVIQSEATPVLAEN